MTIICYSYFKSARGHCINRKMQYSTASTAVIVKALMGASGADANMRPWFKLIRFIAPPLLVMSAPRAKYLYKSKIFV